MGKTFSTGLLTNGLWQDASNNIGIGGSPSGSYKLEVTGTAKVSSRINGVVGGTAYNTAGLWLQGSSSTDGIAIGGTAGGDKTIDTYGGTLKINSTSANGLSVTGASTFSNTLSTASTISINSSDNAMLFLNRSNSAQYGWVRYGTNGTYYWRVGLQSDSTNNFSIADDTNTAKLTVTTAGQVGIGTSSVDSTISVDIQNLSPTSNNVFLRLKNNNGSEDCGLKIAGTFGTAYEHTIGVNTIIASGDLICHNSNSLGYRWYVNGNELFRIKSTGQVVTTFSVEDNPLIVQNLNTSPYGPWFRFTTDINNSTNYYLYCGTDSTARLKILSNGGIANYSGNNVNLASDFRLKKDIIPLSSEWDKLKQIEVVNYKYKDSTEETSLYGAIAQQVQTVYPELVIVTREATETEPEYYGLREQPFQWLTTKVLQEAMTKIEELSSQNQDLKSRLDKAGL